MSEVMKKRLIGLLILIIIAILIPVLLSQCKQESTGSGSGDDMRVYDIQPDGDTALVSKNQTEGQSGEASESGPESGTGSGTKDNEAEAGQQGQIENNDFGTVGGEGSQSGESKFSTPPVHGKSGAQGVAGNHSGNKEATSQSQTRTEREQSASQPDKTASSKENARKKQAASSQNGNAGNSQGSTQKATQPKVAEGTKEDKVHGWVVQIGSFSKSANAMSAVKQVGQSQQASYSQVEVNGKHYYHVYVGPFDNEEAAKAAAAKLKKSGHNTLVRNLP